MKPGLLACLLSLCLATAPHAQMVPVPLPQDAEQTGSLEDPPGRYGVAAGVWNGLEVPFLEMNGIRIRTAWQMPDSPGALEDLVRQVEAAFEDDSFEFLLSCIETTCGGFDFRHRLDILPLPKMYVDLGEFRYLSLVRRVDGVPADLIALMASASGATVHIQIDRVRALAEAELDEQIDASLPATNVLPVRPAALPVESVSGIEEAFAQTGEATLEDLVFASGAADLSDNDYASLAALAAFLDENPEDRIVLVGHTDATGSLEGNVAVSRRRAQAVADRLIGAHDVSASRLVVQGAGFLAPRASNTTEEGRDLNRRVTAVLLPRF